MLKLASVVTYYGNVLALRGISLHVDPCEIVALIGPNGAGKTTALNTISGVLGARSGRIIFDGQDVTGKPSEALVERGLVQVPEGRQLFASMTVYENLLLGTYRRSRAARKKDLAGDLDRVYAIFPILKDRSGQMAGTLSGGEQQMLAIGRALMARPRMLLLDEPSMGLAPLVVKEIFKVISEVRKEGTTVLDCRAEREGGPGHCQEGLCNGDRPGRDGGAGLGAIQESGDPACVPGQRL